MPITGKFIAPFCKWFPYGFIDGLNATIGKFEAFGASPQEIEVEVIDLGTINQNPEVVEMQKAAISYLNATEVSKYDVLITGTSPISREVLDQNKCDLTRFKGVHFLVAFDKDLVTEHLDNCMRVLPSYALEFCNYVEELLRLKPKMCGFLYIDDETSVRLVNDFREACHKLLPETEIIPIALAWEADEWNTQTVARIEEVFGKCELTIISTYSTHLQKLSELWKQIASPTQQVLICLDGIDLLDNEASEAALLNFAGDHPPRMVVPRCVFDSLRLPSPISQSSRVTVRWLTPAGDSIERENLNFQQKYVALFGFDTATAIVSTAVNPDFVSKNLPLSKKDFEWTFPFQGTTGLVAINRVGDLSVPLNVVGIQNKNNRVVLAKASSGIASSKTSTLNDSSKSSSMSLRIKEMLGTLSGVERFLCFVDVTYQDTEVDKNIHWIVAAPSYSAISCYQKVVSQFVQRMEASEEAKGYRVGNHPSVQALLPRLVPARAVKAQEIEQISNGTPFLRIPETLTELKQLFAFVEKNDSAWRIELVDYLSSVLDKPEQLVPRKTHQLSNLVCWRKETDYREITKTQPSNTPPELTDLWKAFAKEAKEMRDQSQSMMSNAGEPLREIYMAPIYISPNQPDRISGYPTDLDEFKGFRIAQVYLGVGWNSDADQLIAEQFAISTVETIRSWLLEQTTVERLRLHHRFGANEISEHFGHQIKRLGLFPKYWLLDETLRGKRHSTQGEKWTRVPKLFEDLGQTLNFWAFGTAPDDLGFSRTTDFPQTLIGILEHARRMANGMQRAKFFANRDMSKDRNVLEAENFVPIFLDIEKPYSDHHIFISTFIDSDNRFTRRAKEWRNLGGLIRYFCVLFENAFDYRTETNACQTIKISIVEDATNDGLALVLVNDCVSRDERRRRRHHKETLYTGSHGADILRHVRNSCLLDMQNFNVVSDEYDSHFKTTVSFSLPPWLRGSQSGGTN